jgi:phosphatidylglycerophosphatase A
VRAVYRFLATLGPVGYLPVAPATWGSAVVVAVLWFVPVPPMLAQTTVAIALILVMAAFAIWIAEEAEKDLGHDAHPIVIDEVVGQSIALLLVPHAWWAYAAAFVLFRVFDIWKPLGAHQAQRLPGGLGIVTDDAIAGLVALGVFHGGLWAARAAGWVA